jgi:Xaa-Pro aminopeptidase
MTQDNEQRIKHGRVADYLEANDLDVVVLSRRCNFSWYTCGAYNHVSAAADAGSAWLLVARDGARVLTTNIEAARLKGEALAGSSIEVVEFPYFDAEAKARAFASAIDKRRAAADVPPAWTTLRPLTGTFDRLRWALTADEITRYESVCNDTVAAVEAVARRVEPGQSELQAAGMLADELLSRGCLPWVLLVAADDRVEKYRHPLPTGKKIRRHVMLVTCAEREGLIAACTRLAHFGPLNAALADKHAAVTVVDTALISSTCPGRTLGEIFAAAQEAYAGTGWAEQWRVHHQGGSCGYLPRDVVTGPGEKTQALANQAFAWNPSITGTKSEDTILCTDQGPELLAKPTDWPMVEADWKGAKLARPAILVR